jgi:hypothetical protein
MLQAIAGALDIGAKKKTHDWSIDHSALQIWEEMVLTTLRRQAQQSQLR